MRNSKVKGRSIMENEVHRKRLEKIHSKARLQISMAIILRKPEWHPHI
jgi:hypothetical protein